MAQLAIKGNATRGGEVIEILGILGGCNAFEHIGNNQRAIYYIDENYQKGRSVALLVGTRNKMVARCYKITR